tara:strand:+ start:14 stop:601 length:588 start_codon:yes stop_codon:yes gene_type:complete
MNNTHDYSAVHQYFERLNEVHHHRSNRFRINNLTMVMTYLSLLIASIGLATLLFLLGYSHLIKAQNTSNHKETKIIEEISGNKPEQIIIDESGESHIVVEDFSKFTHVKTKINGKNINVTTGKDYATEDQKYPSSQWCFFFLRDGKITDTTVFLAKINGQGLRTNLVNTDLAKEISIPLHELEKAQKLCTFKLMI